MVPTQTRKPGINGRAFSRQGKVSKFCLDWKNQGILHKVLENLKKIYWNFFLNWKSQGNLSASKNPANMVPYFKFKKKNLKNTGKVREICLSEKVETMLLFSLYD